MAENLVRDEFTRSYAKPNDADGDMDVEETMSDTKVNTKVSASVMVASFC